MILKYQFQFVLRPLLFKPLPIRIKVPNACTSTKLLLKCTVIFKNFLLMNVFQNWIKINRSINSMIWKSLNENSFRENEKTIFFSKLIYVTLRESGVFHLASAYNFTEHFLHKLISNFKCQLEDVGRCTNFIIWFEGTWFLSFLPFFHW